METAFWRERYAAALATAEARSAGAATGRIACGFTNNVDRVVNVTGATLAALVGGQPLPIDGPPVTRIATPADCLTALLQCLRTGRGSDIPVTNREVMRWLVATVRGRLQLGGTGAQTANSLARLGFDVLLHVTALSPSQASLLDGSGRLLIATADGLLPPATAVRPDDPTMEHVIFEYQNGLVVELSGESIVAPSANRVIVTDDPINAAFPLDPHYVDAVADPANGISRVLISGYTQVTDPATLAARIAATRSTIERWRRSSADRLIHLELGAMPESASVAELLDALAPSIDSVGLNADELSAVVEVWGGPTGDGVEAAIGGLLALQRRLHPDRLSLHTQDYCLTLTTRDPAVERQALLYASLVAATRARIGAFPTSADLRPTLDAGTLSPAGLLAERTLTDSVGLRAGIARFADSWVVFVPTLSLSHPAGTVGLGDSFTAGVLAML